MEILKGITTIIIGLAIAVAMIIGLSKFGNTYCKAMSYNELSDVERGIIRVIDENRYQDLHNSYCFIINLPFIGDTL